MTQDIQRPQVLSRRINRREVELAHGMLSVTLEASEEERRRLAAWLDIPEVKALRATLTLKRWQQDGLALSGTLEARVVQRCVVTLEPVEAKIRVPVERVFAPGSGDIEEPVAFSLDDDDTPEPMRNGFADIGPAVAEELSLGLDPYPRKAGVALAPLPDEEPKETEEPGRKPFAGLQDLLKKP